jgi:D-alanyl-lipoteichoic acid acyltransferase DltB (MBOAT superfamily)
MFFNSLDFAIFFPIVFILYWIVRPERIKLQNIILVAASYLFYGWWDWRFLTLILFSTIVDFSIGVALSKSKDRFKKKILLWISIIVNLGFLGFFKYFNFFLDNFKSAFAFFGSEINVNSLNIILPVGISFYTFQTLSYTIDVYRGKLEPTKDIISFSAFVSFFPQLVAGPIERATNLLPQFYKKRQFKQQEAIDGVKQILWGLFKKMVIADNCAEYANIIFNNTGDFSGATLILGAVFFAFQIYGDFSGYSDIAIGTSRLLGFNLMKNFAFPYFSRDIAEFWRRWHISLSTWFRDYVYIPLGGSRGGVGMKVRNTFIIFIVSGFWHGANWTYIIWGVLNAIYFLPLLLTNKNRKYLNIISNDKRLPSGFELIQIFKTFCLIVFAWIFFMSHAVFYIKRMLQNLFNSESYFEALKFLKAESFPVFFILLTFFIATEWKARDSDHGLFQLKSTKLVANITYFLIFISILLFQGGSQEFIYFQF